MTNCLLNGKVHRKEKKRRAKNNVRQTTLLDALEPLLFISKNAYCFISFYFCDKLIFKNSKTFFLIFLKKEYIFSKIIRENDFPTNFIFFKKITIKNKKNSTKMKITKFACKFF
ncbi:hypothetical protein HYC85_013189 [Camellia sinensis]|uniref:Uncharacterized protein n=1 Tax=Camellia sinensis TaxID=4442 RepID=A0A7J7H2P5_CAMSI|nr:hypothetical protein HYC85_013189 [Camellia sinensis]